MIVPASFLPQFETIQKSIFEFSISDTSNRFANIFGTIKNVFISILDS